MKIQLQVKTLNKGREGKYAVGRGHRLFQIMILPGVRSFCITSILDEETKWNLRAGALIPRCHSSTSLVFQSVGSWAPPKLSQLSTTCPKQLSSEWGFSFHRYFLLSTYYEQALCRCKGGAQDTSCPCPSQGWLARLIKILEGTHSPHLLSICCSWLNLPIFC